MVYCGKASQNCQSCRTRRIKCDKARPQCTQCVRIGKPCPGYRDQLSLMFRDESTKVRQKAHAQWGVQDSYESGEASGSSPTSISPSTITSGRSRRSVASSSSSGPPTPPETWQSVATRVPKALDAAVVDKAVQFYLEHYVIGLPDEARVAQELQKDEWVFSPTTRDIMAAVGFASLSNLTGDKDSMVMARTHYGRALQHTVSSLGNPQPAEIPITIRAVVMLGMFEIVRADGVPVKQVQTHIMGGAALLTSALPLLKDTGEGMRGILQLCYSMVATVQCSIQQLSSEPNVLVPVDPNPEMAEGILPPSFFDLLPLADRMAADVDRPSVELIHIISRLVQLSAFARSQPLQDGQPEVAAMIRKAVEIEEQLDLWEQGQDGIWIVTEERADNFFPTDTVFEDSYHVYADMWTARVWKDYRWARIMVNQLLLECVDAFPATSLPLTPPARQQRSFEVIQRVARDTLVSIPTHYRHPGLELAHREHFDRTRGGAGIGAGGVPTLLFSIKVAGAAPGVPHGYWEWALRILETIWADTGMIQAKKLRELLARAKDGRRRRQSAIYIKRESV